MSLFGKTEKDQLMDEKLLHDYHDPEARKKHKKNITRFFLITLALSIIFSVVNWGIISSWGDVKVTRLFLTGTNGDTISAMMYTPKSATEENPAPLLFNCHGNAGNARNHESWAVEFARRGFVVVSIDHLGAGDSENTILGNESYGNNVLPYMMDIAEDFYAYASNLKFVDKDNIITAGHSMGCGTASSLAARHGSKATMLASGDIGAFIAVKVGLNDLPAGSEAYVEGLANYNGSILLDYGDVEQTPEKLCEKLQTYIDSHPAYNGAQYTEVGQIVGSFEEGNALVALRDTKRPHEAAFVNAETIEHLLWFGQNVVGEENVPNYIEASNQIWQIKDYVGLVGMLIYGLFIVSVALMMIEYIPFFADCRRPLARNLGLRGPGMWISIALGIIFPYISLKLGSTGGLGIISLFGLINPSRNSKTVPGFRLMFTNVAFGLVIALNLLGLLGLLLYYFTEGKKAKVTAYDFGLTPEGSNKLSLKMIAKSILLAALTIAIAWTGIKFGEELFGTDLYAWFFGFKAIPVYKIDNYWWYLIIWVLCFIIACFTINVERRLPSTGKVWLDDILQIVFNVFMATFVLIVAIVVCWNLDATGGKNAFFTFGADIKRLWGMPVGMALGVGGSTLLYRKTGNTWLCAFLMGSVAALFACTFGQVRIF